MVAMATAKMYPKTAKYGHISSDMMLILAISSCLYLQEIQYTWYLKTIFTYTGFTWVNNNFHIPVMCLGDVVTMVTKVVFTETTQTSIRA